MLRDTWTDPHDLRIHAVTSDAASDRCPRRPRWEQPRCDGAREEAFDVETLFTDSVELHPHVPITPTRALSFAATDLASELAAWVANFACPRVSRVRRLRRAASVRRLRRMASMPLGLSTSPCDCVVVRQLVIDDEPCSQTV